MIKNYFKIFIRTSWRNLGFTSINIIGLSLGIASCLIIAMFVIDELSFDTFHKAGDRIFRVISERYTSEGTTANAYVPTPLVLSLDDQYPEIESQLQLTPAIKKLFTVGDKKVYENEGYYADATFWQFFNIPLQVGNANTALVSPRSIVITETLAAKYFGEDWRNENVLSKSITINNRQEYAIVGVVNDPPANFHLDFDFLISSSTLYEFLSDYDRQSWLSPRTHLYLKLTSSQGNEALEEKIATYLDDNVDSKTLEYGYEYEFQLQPLRDIHLYSASFTRDSAKRGNILYVTALIFVAIIILLLACANFINLSTARASKRSKEVGLRKVVGAKKTQIVIQFLSEAVLFSVLSLILGALLVEITLPFFNPLFQKNISLDIMGDLRLLLTILSILLFSGVLAGSYSAFYLSSFQPVKILKKQTGGGRLSVLRKVLVVFQFTMSAILIMGTLVMVSQMQFLQTKDVGFDKEQLVVFPIRGKEMASNLESFKSRVSSHAGINSISATSGLPGLYVGGDDILIPGQQRLLPSKMILADADIINTLGMEILAGRDFSEERVTDLTSAFIINETAAREVGWSPEEAIGKEVHWDIWVDEDTFKRGEVIGVVRDFHYRTMEEKIGSMVIHQYAPEYYYLVAKVSSSDIKGSLAYLKEQYEAYSEQFPFEYHFLDDDFAALYKSEGDFTVLLQVFAVLAIVIACLGLIGLSVFSTEQRRKEISIRKVYGATVAQVLLLINNQFMRLVGISVFTALPVGFYLSQAWLDNYAYKIETIVPQLISAGLISFILALLSVSYLVVRAAVANPAEVLRNE